MTPIFSGERKIRNTDEVFPHRDLFDLPDIRIETHNGPAFHQVILHYIDENVAIGVENYFNTLRFTIRNQIRKYFENVLVIQIRLVCKFETQYGFIERIITYTTDIRVADLGGIDRFTDHLIELFPAALDRFKIPGAPSGIILHSINALMLNMTELHPIEGASYLEISNYLKHSKMIINPINKNDNECFKYCILAYFYIISDINYEHPERVSKLLLLENFIINEYHLNFHNVSYPSTEHDIKQFERNNSQIKIQVYTCDAVKPDERESIYPLHVSHCKPSDYNYVINLLLLNRVVDGIIENSHYVLIKNLNAFFNSMFNTELQFYCPYCFISKSRKDALARHIEACIKQDPQKVEYLKREKDGSRPILEFPLKHNNRRYKHPIVGVVDMEAILRKQTSSSYESTTITNEDSNDQYKLVVKHFPASWGYYDNINGYKDYHYNVNDSPNHVIDSFIQWLIKLAKDNINLILNPKLMEKLTKDEEEQYNNASICQICSNQLISEENMGVQYLGNAIHLKCQVFYSRIYLNKKQFNDYRSQELCTICNQRLPLYSDEKVRDHCHITGKYRGAAHRRCNLNLQLPKFMPIFFHNFQNYDINLFKKEMLRLPNLLPEKDPFHNITFNCIPRTIYKFISISILFPYVKQEHGANKTFHYEIRFLD